MDLIFVAMVLAPWPSERMIPSLYLLVSHHNGRKQKTTAVVNPEDSLFFRNCGHNESAGN
jgi:hypothetical protein